MSVFNAKFLLTALVFVFIAFSLSAQELAGIWFTEKKDAKVQIYRTQSGLYEGKIIWITPKNVEAQKNVGVKILTKLKKEDEKTYSDGKVYHPDQKKYYNATITMLSNNELQLRGYLGVSLFGQTQKWVKTN